MLLAFFNIKPFSFIRSMEVYTTQSRQSINKYGAKVSPCRTRATMLEKSVLPPDEQTIAFRIFKAWLCCPVGCDCRINRLHLCRGLRPPNECPGYDADAGVPVIPWLRRMRSAPSLPSFPGPLWPEVVAPDRVLSMG